MGLTVTYLGHSGFLLATPEVTIAIDPFLTHNSLAKHRPDEIRCQYVALTHGHADHLGDSEAILRQNDATLIACHEVTEYFAELGLTKSEGGNPGGKIVLPFGWIAFTQAFHSSSFKGRYMGVVCGLMIHLGGVTVYHAGDTGLFSDMKLLGEIYRPHIALLPIGDRYTMGPDLASRAAELIAPKVAVPIHYRTFPALVQDTSGFQPQGIQVRIMEPGDSWDYDPNLMVAP